MAYPTPTPSPGDIDWLRALIRSDRDKEDVLRLASIKFGHVWGSELAVLVNAITSDMQDGGAHDVTQAITNALDSLKEPAPRKDTGT